MMQLQRMWTSTRERDWIRKLLELPRVALVIGVEVLREFLITEMNHQIFTDDIAIADVSLNLIQKMDGAFKIATQNDGLVSSDP